jgi:chromosome segregation ATPase
MEKKENKTTNQSLQEEVQMLKRQLAGSKGRNKQLAKENADLKELFHKRQFEKDEAKENSIKGLQSQVMALNDLLAEKNKEIKELGEEIDTFSANYDYIKSLPWYKRIFFKM